MRLIILDSENLVIFFFVSWFTKINEKEDSQGVEVMNAKRL